MDHYDIHHARRRGRPASRTHCEDLYSLELARGRSHIASTLTPATLQAAIVEVIADFTGRYGSEDLLPFLDALAERLRRRNADSAVAAIAHAQERLVKPRTRSANAGMPRKNAEPALTPGSDSGSPAVRSGNSKPSRDGPYRKALTAAHPATAES